MDEFLALFMQTLGPAEKNRVVRHIRRCQRCGREFNEIATELIEIIRDGEAQEAGAAPVRWQWADSRRFHEIFPALESKEGRVLLTSGLIVRAASRPTVPRPGPSLRWRPVAAVVLSIALGSVFTSHAPERAGRPLPVAQGERLVSPRFSGSVPWAPLVKSWRPHLWQYAEPDAGTTRYVALVATRRRVADDPDYRRLATAGVVESLAGSSDSGVQSLQRVVAARPNSAEALNDLGASLLARAEIGDLRRLHESGAELEDHDADLPAALEAIDRALEIAPRMHEALFNRALALERLYLRRSARAAWQAYLAVDPSSAWAREGRQRMNAIQVPPRPDAHKIRAEIAVAADDGDREHLVQLVLSYRHLARASVQEDLLPAWAEAWLARNLDEAGRQLATAGVVADEWEAQTADPTLREAVAEVQTAAGLSRQRLAEGYSDFGKASRALDALELDTAQRAAERALQALPEASRGHQWAALARLTCLGYRGGDINVPAAEIARASPNDPASIGRVYWIAGVLAARRGKYGAALNEYRLALAAYERLDEVDHIAALHHLISDVFGLMGASGACWKHRRIALEHAATLTDRDRAMFILRFSGVLALYQGHTRVAADFLAAALADPDLVEPGQIARTYLWRSRVLLALDRRDDALVALRRADAAMVSAKAFVQEDLAPDLDFAYGLLAKDPAEAVSRLSRALREFRSRGFTGRVPAVLLARARAYLRAGDSASADADLSFGIKLAGEQEENEIAQLSTLRLDGIDELFGERVQLALAQGRTEDAFGLADASGSHRFSPQRPRTSGWVSQSRGELRPAEVNARLDPDTTLLLYSSLPDRVVVWRLGGGAVSMARAGKSKRELMPLINALTADLEAGAWTETTRSTAIGLYSALLGPVEPTTSRLVIVPDESLNRLPFGALVNPKTGRFLIEERELTIAPSASTFLQSRDRRDAQSSIPRIALVVGDPRTDPSLFPGIRSLPGARVEARDVAALYPRREVLLGEAATRTAFLAVITRSDVLHFAGHAIANRVDPARSSLPLAGEPTESPLLVAADIATLDLKRTHTVVLSGCETGAGGVGDDDGPLSLAHAFLAAGVPDVVASLWPIADVPSAPLMTAFHQRLRDGEPAAAALRAAQLSMLHSGDAAQRSPGVWAAFETFGG